MVREGSSGGDGDGVGKRVVVVGGGGCGGGSGGWLRNGDKELHTGADGLVGKTEKLKWGVQAKCLFWVLLLLGWVVGRSVGDGGVLGSLWAVGSDQGRHELSPGYASPSTPCNNNSSINNKPSSTERTLVISLAFQILFPTYRHRSTANVVYLAARTSRRNSLRPRYYGIQTHRNPGLLSIEQTDVTHRRQAASLLGVVCN